MGVTVSSNGNGYGNKAKAKAKTKAEKLEEKEAAQLTQPETDKPTTNIPIKKIGFTKPQKDQISPSVIGIQKLREELLNAKKRSN